MAETSGELERDLRRLREETSYLLGELETRMTEATDVRTQARRHPYAFLGAAAFALAGLGLLTYRLWTRSRGPGSGKSSFGAREPGSRAEDVDQKIVPIRGHGSTHEQHREHPHSQGLVKRVLWGGMASVGLTVTTYMARKVLESAWTRTTGEAPPER